jgi:hypothetical protein
MKLNYRDRIVLTVLIVILVWVAGVMLFIKPAIERLQDSQSALDTAKATRSDLQDRVEADADLPERIVEAYKEVTTMTESFYQIQETQIATRQIDALLAADNITNNDMTISTYNKYKLVPYAYVDKSVVADADAMVDEYMAQGKPLTPETAPAEGEAVAGPVTIGSYEITLNFEGKIDDVQRFCDKMKNSNEQKTTMVSSINYKFDTKKTEGKDGESKEEISDEDVSGTMTLTMMVVKKLPDPNTLAE